MDNKIQNIMDGAIAKLKDVIDTSTVIGEAIETPTGKILPLTKVSIGFVAGGGEYSAGEKQIKELKTYPLSGGTGAGVCIEPLAFLVIDSGKVSLIKVDGKSPLEKVLETAPKVAEAIGKAVKENKNEKN